jgi:hypothetical protein
MVNSHAQSLFTSPSFLKRKGITASLLVSCLFLILSLSATDVKADIVIVGPTNHLHSVVVTGCGPLCSATVTLNPDPVVHLAAAAAGGLLNMTFTADIAQFPGWTLQFGGALNGTLTINDYLARDVGACRGGATMDATYAPAATDPAGLTFINLFSSNAAGAGGGTHIDPFPNDDTEPFYYTAGERAMFGLTFNDNPFDSCPAGCNGTIRTQFHTYLVSFDAANKVATAYDGWMWGYDLVCTPVPEPTTITLMALGIGMLTLKIRRRKGTSDDR